MVLICDAIRRDGWAVIRHLSASIQFGQDETGKGVAVENKFSERAFPWFILPLARVCPDDVVRIVIRKLTLPNFLAMLI